MKIAITGAAGFLGSYLLDRLVGRPELELRALVRSSARGLPHLGRVEWIEGNLQSPEDCQSLVDQVDVIVHLAHSNTPLTSNKDWASDVELNLPPTMNLLHAVHLRAPGAQFLYASSGGAIYGTRASHIPFKETDECNPVNSYGVVKLAIEHYLRLGTERGYFRACSLRISNPYGTILPVARNQGLIGTALGSLAARKPVRIFGSVQNVRDYIHLEDVMGAVDAVLGKPTRGFEVYNVGSGVGTSVQQVIDMLNKLKPDLELDQVSGYQNADKELANWSVLDINKITTETSWRPQVDLAEGLKRLFDQVMRSN